MNFLLFMLFYFICTIILIFIGWLVYIFFLKSYIISKIAENRIEKVFDDNSDNYVPDNFSEFMENITSSISNALSSKSEVQDNNEFLKEVNDGSNNN